MPNSNRARQSEVPKWEAMVWLQQFYLSQCEGDWEHSYGIRIETLDNPGWQISIDLADTPYEGKLFNEFQHLRTENDWIDCRIEGTVFRGFCGPANLSETVAVFRDWVEGASGK